MARFGPCTTPAMFMSCILPGAHGGLLQLQQSRIPLHRPHSHLWTCLAPQHHCTLSSTLRSFSSACLNPLPVRLLPAEHKYDGAIMITASHLPVNRNGAKFYTCEVRQQTSKTAHSTALAPFNSKQQAFLMYCCWIAVRICKLCLRVKAGQGTEGPCCSVIRKGGALPARQPLLPITPRLTCTLMLLLLLPACRAGWTRLTLERW